MAYIALFRPLLEHPEFELPGKIGRPRDQVFVHTAASMDILFQFRAAFLFQHNPELGLLGSIVAAYTLIAYLDDYPRTHAPFAQACQAMHEHSHLPIVPFLLSGLVVLWRQYGVELTDEVRHYLENSKLVSESSSDVPMEMPVWIYTKIHQIDNIFERREMHIESMGYVLSRGVARSPNEDSMSISP